MGRSNPVSIGRFVFQSKTDALDHLRTRLHSYVPGDRVTDLDDIELLTELVEMHPDPMGKKGSGIDHWTVEYNGPWSGGRSLGFHLHRIDGSVDDFGYSKIIKEPSHRARVREALGNAIRDMSQDFRKAAFDEPPVVDAMTGEELQDIKDAKVVHTKPSWSDLCDRTASRFGGYQEIQIEPRDGYYGQYPINPAVVDYIRDLQTMHSNGSAIRLNPVPQP